MTRAARVFGVACDAEVNQQREAVEIGPFGDEIRAVELKNRYHRQVNPAAGWGKAAIGSQMSTLHARLQDHPVAVVTERSRFDVGEAHVRKSSEKFTVRVGDRIRSIGDLAGQLRSAGAGFECREHCRDVVLVLCFEMS